MHAAVDYFGNMVRILDARCFFCADTNPYQVAVAFLEDQEEPLCLCAGCWQKMHAAVLEAEDHYLRHPPRPPQTTPWVLLEALAGHGREFDAGPETVAVPVFEEPRPQPPSPRATPTPVVNYTVASRPITQASDRGELPDFLAGRKPRPRRDACPQCGEDTAPLVVRQLCANGHDMPVDYTRRNCSECGAAVERIHQPGCPVHGPYKTAVV